MKISIFGLGYVGTTSAACLASAGHEIVGVDPNRTKVDLINAGRTPIIEEGLGELIATQVAAKRIKAISDTATAVMETDISFVCVGTPSQLNGNLDLKYVRRVSEQIGEVLKQKASYHVVVVRSTVLPGTMRRVVIPILEECSGKQADQSFGVCFNPEFLREGSAINDFFHPPKTVVGAGAERSMAPVAELFGDLAAPLVRTDLETAEMVKYIDNVWHALKVGFANEIGSIAKALGVDGRQVMDIFLKDTKLNVSPAYLKPGFAFGGSCLPKDLRAMIYRSSRLDLDVPIINAILPSNRRHVARGLQLIMEKGSKKIGILGFSFKAGTDDLRESPMVEVIERLLGKGYDLRIFDKNVKLASLVGANRDYILNLIPHISKLMVDGVDEVLAHGETIVVGNNDPDFRDIDRQIGPEQELVDLIRIRDEIRGIERYEGICW